MNKINSKQIEQTLAAYQEPYLEKDLVTAKVLQTCHINQQTVTVDLQFGFPIQTLKQSIQASLQALVKEAFPNYKFIFNITQKIIAHQVQPAVKAHPAIKNIIAVGSGKGGVGKSTTAVNIALGLQQAGAQVGLLDADIYGPNQPLILGKKTKPTVVDKKFEPVMCYGLQTNSIGYLIEDDQAMIWRGPMVSGALLQLLNDTRWQALDYLIIDLPPGTGDVQLTLAKQVPVSGAVIVTTPQKVAVADAEKSVAMFKRVKVPILGIVENMSVYHCPHCHTSTHLFGAAGGRELATKYQLSLLAEIPLELTIREQTDQGRPAILIPESNISFIYQYLALKIAARLSLQPKNWMVNFPQVIVENRPA
ncbi:MAG: ATPase [Gammaproteobacteria bacterium RIFCSPHIGHO2_12_FULL_35_23]|nr:MAG: ATPase [Gammaproteobacteria bacterium RIFCSPHIGHO2_12_FULL_35_23]